MVVLDPGRIQRVMVGLDPTISNRRVSGHEILSG
jgi:hypothetical protein